ncbi:CAP domain-containing protein [uncultured Croceitalea sp.]|uniref:CAP domain-containing protein n=1 Tax=uncultured Croceitalea sp. TaxID=1798908 RepID=UPI003305A3AE
MKLTHFFLFAFALTIISCTTDSVQNDEALFENDTTTVQLTLSQDETELFDLVNTHRAAQGLNELIFSKETYEFAEEHNKFMIAEGEISHKNFSQRASKVAKKTKAIKVGENVAKSFTTPNAAVKAWLNSKSHKKALEGNYTHSTISITESDEGELYYTQIFFR